MVCAEEHGPVGLARPWQAGDDIANGFEPVVHVHPESDADLAGPRAVREGESTLKIRRRRRAGELLENLSRFAPRQHRRGDVGKGGCRRWIEPHRVGECRHARRERIAVPEPAVFAVASLKELLSPPETVGPRLASHEAVVRRIAVDQNARSAGLFRRSQLDRAMAVPVAGDDEFAADVNAQRGQLRVVGWKAVVHVHDWRRDVPVCRIGDEARPQFRVVRIGIS